MRQVLVALEKQSVTVVVNPTATVLDSMLMNSGRTGVVWQIANSDGSQTLSCYPETREGPTAAWVAHPFTDELNSIAAGGVTRVMWRILTHEIRLMGTASGAGLNAVVWRNSLYGAQL